MTVLEQIENVLIENRISYSITLDTPERKVFQMIVKGDNARLISYITIVPWNGSIIKFETIFPIVIPPDHRSLISEFVTRFNCQREMSVFIMDLDSGQLLYRASLFTDETFPVTADVVMCLLRMTWIGMDAFVQPIFAMMYSGLKIEELMEALREQE